MLQLSTRNLKKVQKLSLAEVRHVIKGGSSMSLLLAGRSNADSFCCASTVHMHAHLHEEHPTASRRLQEHWRNLTDPFRGCKLPVNMKDKSWKGGFCISGELSGLAKIGHDIVLRIIMCDGWNFGRRAQGAFEIPSSGRQPMFFNPIEASLRSALWVCECSFGRSLAVLRRTGQYCTGDTHGQITFVSRTSTVVPAYLLKQEQLQLAQASFRDLQSTASPAT